MYLSRETYDAFASYILGYDAALKGALLIGFNEWLALRLNKWPNLIWSAAVLGILFGDPWAEVAPERDRDAIEGVFELVAAFVAERGEDLTAGDIFARYALWCDRDEKQE